MIKIIFLTLLSINIFASTNNNVLPSFVFKIQEESDFITHKKLENLTQLLQPRVNRAVLPYQSETYEQRLTELKLLEHRTVIEKFYLLNLIEGEEIFKLQALQFFSYADGLKDTSIKQIFTYINRKPLNTKIMLMAYKTFSSKSYDKYKLGIYSYHLVKLMNTELGKDNYLKPIIALEVLSRQGVPKDKKNELVLQVVADYQNNFGNRLYQKTFTTFLNGLEKSKVDSSFLVTKLYNFADKLPDKSLISQFIQPVFVLVASNPNRYTKDVIMGIQLSIHDLVLKMSLAQLSNIYDAKSTDVMDFMRANTDNSMSWELAYGYIAMSRDPVYMGFVIELLNHEKNKTAFKRLVQLANVLSGVKFTVNTENDILLDDINNWWDLHKNEAKYSVK